MSRMETAEIEELIEHLTEEAGEIVTAAMKAARHGFKSHHPDRSTTNKEDLEYELGNLMAVKARLVDLGILDDENIKQSFDEKMETIEAGTFYHHHQEL